MGKGHDGKDERVFLELVSQNTVALSLFSLLHSTKSLSRHTPLEACEQVENLMNIRVGGA
jgi:hypothetical protein